MSQQEQASESEYSSFWDGIPKSSWLAFMGLPAVIIAQYVFHAPPIVMFILCCLAILGTVTLIGKGTEEFALYAGPVWGGLLNATFGNITELIIALFGLRAGVEMHNIVRASITGSIVGNLLLVFGAAMLYGGLKYDFQKFSITSSKLNITLLWVAVIALMIPSVIPFASSFDFSVPEEVLGDYLKHASLAASVLLLFIYILSLIFSFKTHRYHLMPSELEHHQPEWSKQMSIGVLLGATLTVAYLSEVFVHSLEGLLVDYNISELFVGVVIVAIVGNAAEGAVAIWVARDNKMELSFQIALGSCLQVALLVAPCLVIASYFIGPTPMSLAFNMFEILFITAGVLIASSSLQDGESTWLEGAVFLGIYIFFATILWYHP